MSHVRLRLGILAIAFGISSFCLVFFALRVGFFVPGLSAHYWVESAHAQEASGGDANGAGACEMGSGGLDNGPGACDTGNSSDTGASGDGLGSNDGGSGGTTGPNQVLLCPDNSPQPIVGQSCSENGGCINYYAPCPVVTASPTVAHSASAVCSSGDPVVTVSWDYAANTSRDAACQYLGMMGGDLSVPYSSGPRGVWPDWQELPCTGSHTFSNLASSQTYSYWLHIHHTNGDNFDPDNGHPDQEGTVTTPACSSPPIPGTPANFVAACTADNQVQFSWSPTSGATSYSLGIFMPAGNTCPSGWTAGTITSGGTAYTTCDISTSATSLTATVPPNTNMTAPLYAGNATGYSAIPAEVYNFSCGHTLPSTPTLSVSACTAGNNLTLSWGATENTTAYIPSINIPVGSACPSGWAGTPLKNTSGTVVGEGCQKVIPFGTNSVAVTLPSSVPGGATVYSANSAGFSDAASPQNFTCTPPPTATLSASPTTVASGNTTKLTWASTNTTSCTAAGGFSTGGARNGGPTPSVPLTTNPSNFQITCTGPGGSATANTSVTVTFPAVTISASPTRVLSDNKTTVSWTATDVDSCDITRNGTHWKTLPADLPFTSSSPDTISGQTVYKITCNDASAKAHAASVVVNTGAGGFQEF